MRKTGVMLLFCSFPLLAITILMYIFVEKSYDFVVPLFCLMFFAVFVSFLIPIIMIVAYSVKPFIECYEIGIDAFRKKYLEANNSTWFFANLTDEQIKAILSRVDELERWKEDKLLTCSTQKQKDAFLEKYSKHSQKVFYCFIYRSGTRYTQEYYKKTPYIGKTEYWGKYYSPEQLKEILDK